MSVRRSSRLVGPSSVITETLAVSIAVEAPGKRKKTSVAKKKTIKRVKIEHGKEPEHWQIVYERIQEFRKHNLAAVDTMGCERLAEEEVPEKVSRFQTLVSLMLSAQTKDTVTSEAVKNLQKQLPGGLRIESILATDEKRLDELIKKVGFHNRKAKFIKEAAAILHDKFDDDIPNTIEGLTSLPGVGPKMGYLALQVAWKINAGIGVDVHVHRIANRLGWVHTENGLPEDTRKALQSWLPREYWRPVNPLLVGFGQVLCLPRGPRCGECPVREFCPSAVNSVKKVKVEENMLVVVKEEPLEDTMLTVKQEPMIKTEGSLEW